MNFNEHSSLSAQCTSHGSVDSDPSAGYHAQELKALITMDLHALLGAVEKGNNGRERGGHGIRDHDRQVKRIWMPPTGHVVNFENARNG